MFDRNYYGTVSNYNQWMNQTLYAICATILDEQCHVDGQIRVLPA